MSLFCPYKGHIDSIIFSSFQCVTKVNIYIYIYIYISYSSYSFFVLIPLLLLTLYFKGLHVVCKSVNHLTEKKQMQIHKQAAAITKVACWSCIMPIIK